MEQQKEAPKSTQEAKPLTIADYPPLTEQAGKIFDAAGKELPVRPDGLAVVEDGKKYLGRINGSWQAVTQKTIDDGSKWLDWTVKGKDDASVVRLPDGGIAFLDNDGRIMHLRSVKPDWISEGDMESAKEYSRRTIKGLRALREAKALLLEGKKPTLGEDLKTTLGEKGRIEKLLEIENPTKPVQDEAQLMHDAGLYGSDSLTGLQLLKISIPNDPPKPKATPNVDLGDLLKQALEGFEEDKK